MLYSIRQNVIGQKIILKKKERVERNYNVFILFEAVICKCCVILFQLQFSVYLKAIQHCQIPWLVNHILSYNAWSGLLLSFKINDGTEKKVSRDYPAMVDKKKKKL